MCVKNTKKLNFHSEHGGKLLKMYMIMSNENILCL